MADPGPTNPIGWECMSLSMPSLKMVQAMLDRAASPTTCRAPFNHNIAGCTEDAPPLPAAVQEGGWVLDHHRVRIGSGKLEYQKARRLLEAWRQMELGWVATSRPPITVGQPLCISAQSLWIWSRLPLRVVYRKEGKAKVPASSALPLGDGGSGDPRQRHLTWGRRFTFATATLQGHQLQGEERFSVEWHKDDDSVWYEIYTVSKPATPLAKLTYPIVRCHQRKFARCSMRAMEAAVAAPPE